MQVLHVERDWLWRDWIARGLSARGHDVSAATSAEDARRLLQASRSLDVIVIGASMSAHVATLVSFAHGASSGVRVVVLTHDRSPPVIGDVEWSCIADGPARILEAIEDARPARRDEVEHGEHAGASRRGDGGFLVVEDQPIEAAVLRAVLSRRGPVTHVDTVKAAQTLLRTHRWTGVVIDLGLPDGDGLSVLRAMRAAGDATPVLVLTGTTARDAINAAQQLGAEYLVKPPTPQNVERFLLRAIADEVLDDGNLSARLGEIAHRYQLSPRETEIVALAARGAERAELARALSISENTLKAQIRSVLRKTATTSYQGLARLLLER